MFDELKKTWWGKILLFDILFILVMAFVIAIIPFLDYIGLSASSWKNISTWVYIVLVFLAFSYLRWKAYDYFQIDDLNKRNRTFFTIAVIVNLLIIILAVAFFMFMFFG